MKVLFAFAAVFLGWQLFEDGPLAYYIAAALLIAGLCVKLAIKEPELALAYACGTVLALLTAGCGALFSLGASGKEFLCDKGTGLPVSMVSGAVLLVVAALMLRKGRR